MALRQEPPPGQRFGLQGSPDLNLGGQGANLDWGQLIMQILDQRRRQKLGQPQQQEQQSQAQGWPQFQQRQQLPIEDLRQLIQGQQQLGQQSLETFSPMAQAKAARYLQDPYGAAVSDRDAQMAGHSGIDWFKQANNIPELTPEAALGMQGNSAANQWAKLGAFQGVDPNKVKQFSVNRRFPT